MSGWTMTPQRPPAAWMIELVHLARRKKDPRARTRAGNLARLGTGSDYVRAELIIPSSHLRLVDMERSVLSNTISESISKRASGQT